MTSSYSSKTLLERQRIALDDSIAHWRRLSEWRKGTADTPRGIECALCREFHDTANPDPDPENEDADDFSCWECPIRQKTGRTECDGTPWIWAYRAFIELEYGTATEDDVTNFRRCARDMHDWLVALRKELFGA